MKLGSLGFSCWAFAGPVAVEDVELIIVPLSLMEKWMMEHRSWNEFVIYTYRIRFEELLEVVDNIAFRAMDERLEFYLKRHSDACGCKDVKLSHQEIARDLNTSREVISRLLKKMESGIIGNKIFRINSKEIIEGTPKYMADFIFRFPNTY